MTLKNKPDDNQQQLDKKFMKRALELASKGVSLGEVPIGALVVNKEGKILAEATNLREQAQSVLGHAELVAIHRASKRLQSWRLIDCTLYVSLEPCLMCAAALVQSRIARVVFATPDLKGGGLGSLEDLSNDSRLNHKFSVSSGIFENESRDLLKKFFQLKRKNKKI